MAGPNEQRFSLAETALDLPNGVKFSRMIVGKADDPSAPNVMISQWPPGTTGSPHQHASDYMELILEGSQTVGKDHYSAGEGRIVRAGQSYGPLVAGPEGCRVLHVFATGDFRPIPAGKGPEQSLYRDSEELYGDAPGAALS